MKISHQHRENGADRAGGGFEMIHFRVHLDVTFSVAVQQAGDPVALHNCDPVAFCFHSLVMF
jgi:hypothetical protein